MDMVQAATGSRKSLYMQVPLLTRWDAIWRAELRPGEWRESSAGVKWGLHVLRLRSDGVKQEAE